MSIYFDEYQLGAYAQGESTVKLAYSKFGDLLAPECAVSSLAAKCPANPNDPIQITRKHLQQDLAILAISALSKAITEGPSDPTAYHQRAYWYQKLGRKEAAEADLKQATSLEKAADTPASVEKVEDNPVDSTSQTKIDSAATKEVDQAIDQPLAEAGARIISRTQLAEPLGGIGARIHVDKGNLLVVKIIPETPASNAGLQSGDRITAIDGEPTDGLSEAEAASLIRGPVGSDVSLSICRKNDEGNIKVIKIKRALIKSLSWLH
jgi:C-terminal processing protease CtpA/Prc